MPELTRRSSTRRAPSWFDKYVKFADERLEKYLAQRDDADRGVEAGTTNRSEARAAKTAKVREQRQVREAMLGIVEGQRRDPYIADLFLRASDGSASQGRGRSTTRRWPSMRNTS